MGPGPERKMKGTKRGELQKEQEKKGENREH